MPVVVLSMLSGTTEMSAQMPQSYGQYYQKNIQKYSGQLGTQSSSRYLYDKYFYHNTAVSPYINMGRPGTMGGTNYQAYVRPEQERRQAAERMQSSYLQQRKMQGNIGETRFPGAGFVGGTIDNAYMKPVPAMKTTPSAYYNHWYGNWANQ
jgi:hypothetical protein